jgi:protein-tyrosine phosphatase
MSRHVELQGIEDFRDLGGCTTSGGMTRWRRVYRSDNLVKATEHDVRELLELGLRTVVDLRLGTEIAQRPHPFMNLTRVRYVHNPMTNTREDEIGSMARLARLNFRELYIDMLRSSGATFTRLFGVLAEESSYPLVFHCSAGRDRTGVVAALVLAASGVESGDITHDYMLSTRCAASLGERIRVLAVGQGVDADLLLENFALRPSFMDGMLEALETELGGVEGYLGTLGVTADTLDRFREHFVQ